MRWREYIWKKGQLGARISFDMWNSGSVFSVHTRLLLYDRSLHFVFHAGCFGLSKQRSMLESVFSLRSVQTIFSRGRKLSQHDSSVHVPLFILEPCLLDIIFPVVFLSLPGSGSGVLAVKILELHEECTIQVAMCEQLVGLQAGSSSQGEASGPGLKVLFSKETAHHLRGQPQDIIHIYPPWWVLGTDSRSHQL